MTREQYSKKLQAAQLDQDEYREPALKGTLDEAHYDFATARVQWLIHAEIHYDEDPLKMAKAVMKAVDSAVIPAGLHDQEFYQARMSEFSLKFHHEATEGRFYHPDQVEAYLPK